MKEESIIVRINPVLKRKYQSKLKDMNISMSKDISNHIYTVVNSNIIKTQQKSLYDQWRMVYDILRDVNFKGRKELLETLGEIEHVIY